MLLLLLLLFCNIFYNLKMYIINCYCYCEIGRVTSHIGTYMKFSLIQIYCYIYKQTDLYKYIS